MDRVWLFVGAVAVFAVRDAWAPPRSAYAFVAVTLLAGLAAAVWARLYPPPRWTPGCRIRFFGQAASRRIRAWRCGACGGRGTRRPAAWVAALPSPVFAVALVLTARIVLERTNALSGWQAGAAAAGGYLLLVAALGAGVKKIGGAGSRSRLAAWSHLTAVLLVPWSPVAAGAGTAREAGAAPGGGAVEGWAAALGVASVTALSFAWHRYRSNRRGAP